MPNLNLEQALCEAIEAAGRAYQRAVEEIETISAALASGAAAEKHLERLAVLSQRTCESEARLSRLRDQWRQSAAAPGARLRAAMQHQERLLCTLIARTEQAEQLVRAARDRLAPSLDAENRSQQMRSAYARAVHRAAGCVVTE